MMLASMFFAWVALYSLVASVVFHGIAWLCQLPERRAAREVAEAERAWREDYQRHIDEVLAYQHGCEL